MIAQLSDFYSCIFPSNFCPALIANPPSSEKLNFPQQNMSAEILSNLNCEL